MGKIPGGRLSAALALVCALGGAVCAQPTKEEWKKLAVREGGEVKEYFIVPDARLRALGLKIEDIPDDQNAAFVYWQAFSALPDLPEDKAVGNDCYNKAIKAPWGPDDGPEWKAFHEWFQSTAESRRLLRKAAAMEKCRFPELLREQNDEFLMFGVLLPHLANMRNAARLCAIEANLLEKQGKPREALEVWLLTMPMAATPVRTACSFPLLSALPAFASAKDPR